MLDTTSVRSLRRAHLSAGLRRRRDRRWDSLMIQANDRTEDLLAFVADMPPMAARYSRDQTAHVQPLEYPADRVAMATAFIAILRRSIERKDMQSTARTAPSSSQRECTETVGMFGQTTPRFNATHRRLTVARRVWRLRRDDARARSRFDQRTGSETCETCAERRCDATA
jgi:hypothetical protein